MSSSAVQEHTMSNEDSEQQANYLPNVAKNNMSTSRVTMAGWATDVNRSHTLSTLDDSEKVEVAMSEEGHHKPVEEEESSCRNRKKCNSKVIMVVFATAALISAGLAVGFLLYGKESQDEAALAKEGPSDFQLDSTIIPTTGSPTTSMLVDDIISAPPSQNPATGNPTNYPSQLNSMPTKMPSIAPDAEKPTLRPTTESPTEAFSWVPSFTSTPPTALKSASPSLRATNIATSAAGTIEPTTETSNAPSQDPTIEVPSETPSAFNSITPTTAPSDLPSQHPSNSSVQPSEFPSQHPTSLESNRPSDIPSFEPTIAPSENPSIEPSVSPTTTAPTLLPSLAPSIAPSTSAPTTSEPSTVPSTTAPTTSWPTRMPAIDSEFATIVLEPNQRLERGEFVISPSGRYQVGLSSIGDFELIDNESNNTIWHADIVGGYRCYMQGDGNCIIRDEDGKSLWSTKTSNNDNSQLILDDAGMIGIFHEDSYIWIHGNPRGTYNGPNDDITFPIRGAFYYNWYPETWKVSSGAQARFVPDTFGYYKSADPMVIEAHIDQLDYGHVELGIISWWGESRNNERSRISLLQNMTTSLGSGIKWSIYYEEYDKVKTEEDVREDLAHLTEWFTWHPTWAYVDGKPVIFVYQNKGCDNVDRWVKASNGEWHVVLKLFIGFEDCPSQPDSWHQYAPARDVMSYEGYSFSISPGFWHAGESEARLPRVNKTSWCNNVQDMVDSGDPWQLITTFNEAGEGTLIEPSASWASDTGYGYYLDCLHDIF